VNDHITYTAKKKLMVMMLYCYAIITGESCERVAYLHLTKCAIKAVKNH